MVLLFFSAVAWLVVSLWAAIPKSIGKMENVILYFLLVMVSTSVSSTQSLNCHMVELNMGQSMFISYWLERTVLMPLLHLICVNFFWGLKGAACRAVVVALAVLSIMAVEWMAVFAGVKAYIRWNYAYSALVSLGITLMFLPLAKWIRRPA